MVRAVREASEPEQYVVAVQRIASVTEEVIKAITALGECDIDRMQ